MLNFFKREMPSLGIVFFNSNMPFRPEAFADLQKLGVKITAKPPANGSPWTLELSHRDWGKADLLPLEKDLFPPRDSLGYLPDWMLSDKDRSLVSASGSAVLLRVDARRKNVLADRKNLLRWMKAVLHDAEGIGFDTQSSHYWSPETLELECAHDAELDISSLFVIHSVSESNDDKAVLWAHTHGLRELGAFDIDIVKPSREGENLLQDSFRSMAFQIVEGRLKPDTERFTLVSPGDDLRLVPIQEFLAGGPKDQTAVLEHDPENMKQRAIVCEAANRRLWNIFRSSSIRAATVYQSRKDVPRIINYSTLSSDLMGRRALNTVSLFPAFLQEFSDLHASGLVKVCFQGAGEHREHMWCTCHSIGDSELDLTVENEPFNIPEIHKGDRVRKPLTAMSDWIGKPWEVRSRPIRSARFGLSVKSALNSSPSSRCSMPPWAA